MIDSLNYINSGNAENDSAIKEWINKRPKGFTVDFAKDCSRHGNPDQYKVVLTRYYKVNKVKSF